MSIFLPRDLPVRARPLRIRRRRVGVSITILLAVVTSSLVGCASRWGPVPSEADLAAIKPGMTQAEVLARVGRPTWIFGVRQENLTILNYRYNHNDCVIYQISMRPDGTVRDAAQGYDPACDGPSRRF